MNAVSPCVYAWCETHHEDDEHRELTGHHFQTVEVIPGMPLYLEVSDGQRSASFDPMTVEARSRLVKLELNDLHRRLLHLAEKVLCFETQMPRQLRRDAAVDSHLREINE